MPVFLPDEQVGCLFEVLGTVTVRGPFRARNDGGNTSVTMMDAVRSKLGIEAARADADAALVRRFTYDRDRPLSPGELPTPLAVEGVLLKFVDSDCRLDPTPGMESDWVGDEVSTLQGSP